jgi:hypothetical protein
MDLLRRALRKNSRLECTAPVLAKDKEKQRGKKARVHGYYNGNDCGNSQRAMVWCSVIMLILAFIFLYVLLGLVASQSRRRSQEMFVIPSQ